MCTMVEWARRPASEAARVERCWSGKAKKEPERG